MGAASNDIISALTEKATLKNTGVSGKTTITKPNFKGSV